ncbi:hypothetical protein B0H13DRAFT_2311571 [Mycena leptocephala]|nr:hypothetical protein B0H13DRAFT_2311571 [Mycena leptocephala]
MSQPSHPIIASQLRLRARQLALPTPSLPHIYVNSRALPPPFLLSRPSLILTLGTAGSSLCIKNWPRPWCP